RPDGTQPRQIRRFLPANARPPTWRLTCNTNILVLIGVGKGRDETEASPLSTLPSPQETSIRRPWAGGLRVRGIGARIYADLRAELVSLERLPGEPISEAELAKSYGFSRTPVREAVRKLADEGLVEIFPQSGTFAA